MELCGETDLRCKSGSYLRTNPKSLDHGLPKSTNAMRLLEFFSSNLCILALQ
jgi:hypothetical protein